MKRKWIILISVVILLLAGGVWFNSGSEPPIKITGNLSAKDVNEIKRVVKRDVRARILPGLSVENVKALPQKVKVWSRFRIARIDLRNMEIPPVHSGLIVTVDSHEIFLAPKVSESLAYVLEKTNNTWKIVQYDENPTIYE